MIGRLSLLRIKQIYRLLNRNGLGGFFLAIFFLLTLCLLPSKLYSIHKYLFYFVVTTILLFIHLGRKDKMFLKKMGVNGFYFILIEYFIITCVMLLSVMQKLTTGDVKYVTGLLLINVLLVRFSKEQPDNPVTRWIKALTVSIPIKTYECRFGIRRYFFLFSLSYFISLLIIPFLPITPFLLFYLSTFIFEFYKENDPKEFIQSNDTVDKFLNNKIFKNIIFLNTLLLPHYVLYSVFHSYFKELSILILSVFIFCLLITYSILLKYSVVENKVSNAILFFLVSPLLPISLILLFIEQKKAKCQLTKLLQ